jgi:hypothetical protein
MASDAIVFEAKKNLFLNYTLESKGDRIEHGFQIDRARIDLQLEGWQMLEVLLEYDFADVLDGRRVLDGIGDAVVSLQPAREFGVSAGHFKRPGGAVDTLSRRKMPVIGRGGANKYLCEHLMFGDRDFGLMVSGRIGAKYPRFEYAAGAFNGLGPMGDIRPAGFIEPAARVSFSPAKWLEAALFASMKTIDDDTLGLAFDPGDFLFRTDRDYPDYMNQPVEQAREGFNAEHGWMKGNRWMTGADVRLKKKGVFALVEGELAQNWWYRYSPWVWSVAALVSYTHEFDTKMRFALEPVAMIDLLTVADGDFRWQSRLWTLQAGLNIHLTDVLRLMIQGEFIFTNGTDAYFDETPRKGFWPGEWPGDFEPSTALSVQFTLVD